MKKFFRKAWSAFLTAFGNIKVFRWPMWIVYDPDDFQVTGEKTLDMLRVLEPGDIVIRGYKHYADGMFIPSKAGWSHGAVYVGNNQIIHAISSGVQYIDAVEFSRCDRIAVLRPKSGQGEAIRKARKFVEDNVGYDFFFEKNVSALYCFELCAECYPKLDVEPKKVSKFLGLFKKNVYLAESFFESRDFETIMEFNPRRGVDYLKPEPKKRKPAKSGS